MQAYRNEGLSEREARIATSLDLGHGDGRGRYVASVYVRKGRFAAAAGWRSIDLPRRSPSQLLGLRSAPGEETRPRRLVCRDEHA